MDNHTGVPPVAEMVGDLEARLERQPDDLQGWRLLAQSYAFLGDMQSAREATDRAVVLGADRDEVEAAVRRAHTTRGR